MTEKLNIAVKIDSEKKQHGKIWKFFDWLWNSESITSYLVFLVIVFVFVKFIFLPGLGLIFGSALPMAIVESSSMDHHALLTPEVNGNYICGKLFPSSKFLNKEEYWQTCGQWYEDINISDNEFANFKFANGFSKGDLMIIFGKSYKDIKVGDVIIFNAGRNHPIIHRVISLNPLQTKGDHNSAQLPEETNIQENQIIGVAVGKAPYIGWIKLFFVELWGKIRS